MRKKILNIVNKDTMGFFQNLFGSIKDIGSKVWSGFKGIGSKIGSGLQNVGSKIGGFANLLGSGYNIAKNIPILGDILKNSPVGSIVESGLGALGSGGNLLGNLGTGDFSGALSSGKDVLSNVTSTASKIAPLLTAL